MRDALLMIASSVGLFIPAVLLVMKCWPRPETIQVLITPESLKTIRPGDEVVITLDHEIPFEQFGALRDSVKECFESAGVKIVFVGVGPGIRFSILPKAGEHE